MCRENKLRQKSLSAWHQSRIENLMPTQTNEAALEACIERALTGGVTEGVVEGLLRAPSPDIGGNGWKRGKPGDFNAEFAVDEAMLWQFMESTQAKVKRLLQSVGHCNTMSYTLEHPP